MHISKKWGVALATVGVLALSACGSSDAKLLESSKTKNAALDDNSGLNVKVMSFNRESLNGWEGSEWGSGLEDQILRDESKNTACPNGITSVPNIDGMDKIIESCQAEFLLVHYTGFITAPGEKGSEVAVKFRVAKDDTFSMKVGGTQVIDAWNNTGCEWVEGEINMVAGKQYPLDAWFSQFRGGICNQMTWSVDGGEYAIVPPAALSRGSNTADQKMLSSVETNRTITGIGGNIRGIATDGSKLYVRTSDNSNGVIYETGFDGQNTVKHVIQNAAWDVDGQQANLAMSHGCIWSSTHNSNKVYCIDTNTWTAKQIDVPADKPLPAGQFWMHSNMTDFPDGRIARISRPTNVGGTWQSTLRVYNVTGNGAAATLSFDRDWILTDTQGGWPSDDHGIATDGKYLYRIRYARGYKVWDLSAGSTVPVYFNGDGEGACAESGTLCPINPPDFSNATYIAHDHVNSRYLVGDFDRQQYYYTVQGAIPKGVTTSTTLAPESTTTVEATTTTEAAAGQQAAATTTTIAPPVSTIPAIYSDESANAGAKSVKASAQIPLTSIIMPKKGSTNRQWSVTGTCKIAASNLVAPSSATTCQVKLIQTVKKKVKGKTTKKNVTRTATVVVM